MAELATIARPYAEALFKACVDKGADLNSTVAWVEELAAIAANPQLRQLADNPNVSDAQVFDLVTGVAVGIARVRTQLPACGPRKRPSGRAA